MAKTYYHNITTGLLNVTDTFDLYENLKSMNDKVYKTEGGNAILEEVPIEELEQIREEYYNQDQDN